MWDTVCNQLGEVLGEKVELNSIRSVSGGCIHQAKALETSSGTYFAKVNRLEALPMFEAEATGLAAIAATKTVRCPNVILIDQINGQAVLVLEYIPMTSASRGSMTLLGKQLAAMHQNRHEQFGWPQENHIGRTPQTNAPCQDWVEFYRTRRLEYQLKLCRDKGLRISGADRLLEHLETYFEGYRAVPSLLHGDLWGGNAGFTEDGTPIIFDPACYYGDHEADLAFTEMFGGFSPDFYAAYREVFSLNQGYQYRKRLYNLYHELNHYYLFGGGYGSQARSTVEYLLSLL